MLEIKAVRCQLQVRQGARAPVKPWVGPGAPSMGPAWHSGSSRCASSPTSLLPPPPPPGAGVAFLSSPLHSHAGSRRRKSTAAPTPEWNAPKFWNLNRNRRRERKEKPWRGYLPGGSLEAVSSVKSRRVWRGGGEKGAGLFSFELGAGWNI